MGPQRGRLLACACALLAPAGAAADAGGEPTCERVIIDGATGLDTSSPQEQARLVVHGARHVLHCARGAAERFGVEYAAVAMPFRLGESLGVLEAVMQACSVAPDLSHASGCGAEIRLYGLGVLASVSLAHLDIAACGCPEPSAEVRALSAGSALGAESALAHALGGAAATLLGLSAAAHALALAADGGLAGERASVDLNSAPLGGTSAHYNLRLLAAIEAALSPLVDAAACAAAPTPPPRRWRFVLGGGGGGGLGLERGASEPPREWQARTLARAEALAAAGDVDSAGATLLGLFDAADLPAASAHAYTQFNALYAAAGRAHESHARYAQARLSREMHGTAAGLLVMVLSSSERARAGSRAHAVLRALFDEASGVVERLPPTVARRAAEGAEHAAKAIVPALALFPACAAAIAAAEGLGDAPPTFLATDSTPVGAWLLPRLGPRARLDRKVDSLRMDGHWEPLDDKAVTRGALSDLLLTSRARFFIGTHSSTYTMLAAGMAANSSAHYLVYPRAYDRCVRSLSPLASHAAATHRLPSGVGTGWGPLSGLGKVSCMDGEGISALLAVGGVYNPFAELRPTLAPALPTDPPTTARAARLLAAGGAVAEAEATSVRALLADYARLHAEQLAAAAAGEGGRLLVAVAYCNNIGNRAMNLLAYTVLALATGRALVLDSSWLEGFALPFAADVRELPEPLRARVLGATGGLTRVRTHWFEYEPGVCEPLAPAACAGADELCVLSMGAAPHILQLVANPHHREHYAETIGYSGAGLRELMRWLFQPTAELLAHVEALERELCGAVRGCDIALHVRRGRTASNDYFF